MVVTFNPTDAVGIYRASLDITSNDAVTGSTSISLIGQIKHANGLLAHYPMDETSGTVMEDSSGNGFHGSYISGSGSVTFGADALASGTAVSLSEGNDAAYAEIAADAGFTSQAQATYSFWVQQDAADVGTATVLFSRSASPANPYAVFFESTGGPDPVTWTSEASSETLASEPFIAPGETFTATFTATHAGTSWYHPHFDTARQVDLGLYGALVVTDPDEPAVDRDLVVIADAWGEHDARTPPEGDNHHGLDGAGMTWTFNGAIDPVLDVEPGERVRLRLINASNTGYLDLAPTSGARFIAGDQGLWAGPADHALLGPGDRVEAELVVGGDDVGFDNHAYSLYGGTVGAGELTARLHLRPTAAGAAPALADWPWRSPSTSPDPGRTDLRFVLQGDSAGEHWTINGETFPDVTVPYVPIGQDTLVEVRNISPTNHPFHMHGHAFEVLSIDGVPLPDRPVEDTVDERPLAAAIHRSLSSKPERLASLASWIPVYGALETALDGAAKRRPWAARTGRRRARP